MNITGSSLAAGLSLNKRFARAHTNVALTTPIIRLTILAAKIYLVSSPVNRLASFIATDMKI